MKTAENQPVWPGYIDLQTEHPITLSRATKIPHLQRDGQPPHISTVYRWTGPNGCRGIRLEAVRIGGKTCTTVAAVKRFIDRMSRRGADPVLPHDRRQEQEAAEAVCAKAGL